MKKARVVARVGKLSCTILELVDACYMIWITEDLMIESQSVANKASLICADHMN